ncbi:site-specific integrase [bacterium]|nr:site-specific integrase [bacterium]
MTTVSLHHITHCNQSVLIAKFPYDKQVFSTILNSKLGFWDHYQRGIILKNSTSIIKDLKELMDGIAVVNENNLHSRTEVKIKLNAPTLEDLNQNLSNKINSFRSYLEQRRYSNNTIKSYAECIGSFFRFFKNKDIDLYSPDDLAIFNKEYILKYGYSVSYQKQVINAVKLFFKSYPSTVFNIEDIERPRNERRLPIVLSLKEVETLLNGILNIKHKTMIMLIYSCGLRRGELLALRIRDIDSDRMLIHIKQAKGKKDRMVPLSETMLNHLRTYAKLYSPPQF